MTFCDLAFPLGIGTNRFSVKGLNDESGIAAAAQMVADAIRLGVEYVDLANTYSRGVAGEVCRRAFAQSGVPPYVTVKSSFLTDKSADDALRRAQSTMRLLHIDHAGCFVFWNISSYEQFLAIMRKGSLYEGALSLKEQGWIDHICFSSHAPPADIIKMISSGAFESVTISFSPLNSAIMQPVLDCAAERDVGVVVMNPLGGGLIPQHRDYYEFLRYDGSETTVQATLRYVYAHPAVKIVLSGISDLQQFQENLNAFREESREQPQSRFERVNATMCAIEGFCTGCRYCDGCPQDIDIYELMQAWNTMLFPKAEKLYNRTDLELLENIGICSRLKNTFGVVPIDTENPCIACGRCERACTAHLPIISRIHELYERFKKCGFSKAGMLGRLRDLIGEKRRIAFYPGGGYTAYVLELLNEAFSDEEFELFAFDGNSALWGSEVSGVMVRAPKELQQCAPELVIISNYMFSDEIYQELSETLKGAIPIVKLHEKNDVPWVF